MFKRLSQALSSLYRSFTHTDPIALAELEKTLIQADTGVETTQKISAAVKKSPEEPQQALTQILKEMVNQAPYQGDGAVILLVGINGSGKTTTAAKLAALLQAQGGKVLLAAADTFRAAAVDQLTLWAERLSIPLVKGAPQQDPSAVVYQACAEYKKNNYTTLIIDTAGRLQTKSNLMQELEKMHRTITKQLPDKKITVLLTVDSMLGQNSFEQVKLFHEATHLDGIILTKTDGTGKGGIVFAIVDTLKIPIAYVTFGEQPEDIAPFDGEAFVSSLIEKYP